MKNKIKIIIKAFALVAVIFAAYFFISKHATDFAILKTISAQLVIILAVIYLVEITLNSLLFGLLINSFSKKISISFRYYLFMSFRNKSSMWRMYGMYRTK